MHTVYKDMDIRLRYRSEHPAKSPPPEHNPNNKLPLPPNLANY